MAIVRNFPFRKMLGLVTLLLSAGPAVRVEAADVVFIDFNPGVIDPRVPEPVTMTVRTDGTVEVARLILYASSLEIDLEQTAPDTFQTTVSAEQARALYGPEDVQHNFLGYLETYSGGVRLGRRNVFLSVADASVPPVQIRTLGPDARASSRVLALFMPGGLPSELDLREISRRFYQLYPDDFDFLNVVTSPMYNANRTHIGVKNDVLGIGLSLTDNSAEWGSAGRLRGINRFPILSIFDLAETGALHEVGHTWIDFLTVPGLGETRPHWPLSSTASGVMGISLPNGVGVNFPWALTPQGDGVYRMDSAPIGAFNEMELYLMGLMAPSEVGPQVVFSDRNQTICAGCLLTGGRTLTIDDVVAVEGPRSPAYPDAPSTFKLATIVVSTLRPLTDREIAFVDYFAARGEATTELPCTSGFAVGMTQPFFVATRGRGRWITSLDPPRLQIDIRPRRASNRINLDRRKSVAVAILSGEGVAPSLIDPASLRFGPNQVSSSGKPPRLRDLNQDGEPDLVARFKIRGAGLQCGMTEASLTATTVSGQALEGSDSIVIVPCPPKPPRHRGSPDPPDPKHPKGRK